MAKCVSDILGADGVSFNERAGPVATCTLHGANQWFGNTQAGGLGWCLPAALGFQLADRDRLTVCVLGDGAYMFANPVACHQVAEAYELPVLTVVLNNDSYDAVRQSTLEVYPKGVASKSNVMPMVPLAPTPDYCAIAGASRAWTRRVERAEDLPAALQDAVDVIRNEKRQALIDVVIAKG